ARKLRLVVNWIRASKRGTISMMAGSVEPVSHPWEMACEASLCERGKIDALLLPLYLTFSMTTAPTPTAATNFLRNIIEDDLQANRYQTKRWAGKPGPASVQTQGEPDTAR